MGESVKYKPRCFFQLSAAQRAHLLQERPRIGKCPWFVVSSACLRTRCARLSLSAKKAHPEMAKRASFASPKAPQISQRFCVLCLCVGARGPRPEARGSSPPPPPNRPTPHTPVPSGAGAPLQRQTLQVCPGPPARPRSRPPVVVSSERAGGGGGGGAGVHSGWRGV